MKRILFNDFHNTETYVLSKDYPQGKHPFSFISSRQLKEADKRLCGIKGCECGAAHRNLKRENVEFNYDGSVRIYWA